MAQIEGKIPIHSAKSFGLSRQEVFLATFGHHWPPIFGHMVLSIQGVPSDAPLGSLSDLMVYHCGYQWLRPGCLDFLERTGLTTLTGLELWQR